MCWWMLVFLSHLLLLVFPLVEALLDHMINEMLMLSCADRRDRAGPAPGGPRC